MHFFHKMECYKRAQELINIGDESSLRYACLELRQCIESICYDKLRLYSKFIPESEFERWQPKRVFELLEALEPKSVQDYYFQVYDQSNEKTILNGIHHTLKSQHINKIYNKLGSYLHTPTISQQKEYTKKSDNLKNELLIIFEDLSEIVSSKFDTNIGVIVTFSCESCGELIYHRQYGLEIGSHVKCPRSECGMLYVVEDIQGETVSFKPVQAIITCACGKDTFLNYYRLKEGSHVKCECGKIYDVSREWGFKERI